MAQLKARIWVDAYRRRLGLLSIPVYVLAHGDDDSGAILVKLSTLDGQAQLYQRIYDLMQDRRVWDCVFSGPEPEADAFIEKQRHSDTDLWVIEVEDRAGRHLLDDDGLGG